MPACVAHFAKAAGHAVQWDTCFCYPPFSHTCIFTHALYRKQKNSHTFWHDMRHAKKKSTCTLGGLGQDNLHIWKKEAASTWHSDREDEMACLASNMVAVKILKQTGKTWWDKNGGRGQGQFWWTGLAAHAPPTTPAPHPLPPLPSPAATPSFPPPLTFLHTCILCTHDCTFHPSWIWIGL